MMRWLPLLMLLLLAGCQAKPVQPTQSTAPVLPEQWQQTETGEAISLDWWQQFGNAELTRLVQLAAAQSYDLQSAAARIRQAQAAATIAGAALWPNLDGQFNAGQSGELDGGEDNHRFTTGLAASYEVDLWGGIEARQQAALANLEFSQFDYDAMALSLAANVANQWLQWVGNQERLSIANNNLEIAQRLLEIIRYQHEVGKSSELDVVRQHREVANQQRLIAGLKQQVNQSRVALNILLGQAQNVSIQTHQLNTVDMPDIHAGIPAELLLQRPDIARAEASLRAANANLDVARAAMLPRMTLSAELTAGNERANRMLDAPLYSLLAGLTMPIFNHGALAAGVNLAAAEREALLANYHQSIVAAVGDTQNALFVIDGVAAQLAAQQLQLTLARQAYDLSEMRYLAGADSLTTLLQTQRDLFDAEDGNVSLRLMSLQARVDLYRALGGGWQR